MILVPRVIERTHPIINSIRIPDLLPCLNLYILLFIYPETPSSIHPSELICTADIYFNCWVLDRVGVLCTIVILVPLTFDLHIYNTNKQASMSSFIPSNLYTPFISPICVFLHASRIYLSYVLDQVLDRVGVLYARW